MKRPSWQVWVGAGLLAVSGLFYVVHYLVFRDAHHIFLWSFTSMAFLPVSVLFVTLIINRLLTVKQKQQRLQKLNMVIGAFFSEVGTTLLSSFSGFDPEIALLRERLGVNGTWDKTRFQETLRWLKTHSYRVEGVQTDLPALKSFLISERDFLLRLLENPNLLEHEAFTTLLRAVFHLAEELGYRRDFSVLPAADVNHLAGDIRRAYVMLVRQWVDYMHFMKVYYPYLFSLAVRTSPFDAQASAVIQEPRP